MYKGSAIGVRSKERINRTRMTRIERIDADPFLVLSAMIRARLRHPRSINTHTNVKMALVVAPPSLFPAFYPFSVYKSKICSQLA
jgi:hypothetical protein